MDPTVLARVEVGKENAHERSPPASLGQADGRGGGRGKEIRKEEDVSDDDYRMVEGNRKSKGMVSRVPRTILGFGALLEGIAGP